MAAAVVRSRAPTTLRTYRSDWKDFAVFCEQLGVEALPSWPIPPTIAGRPGSRPSPVRNGASEPTIMRTTATPPPRPSAVGVLT